MRVDIITIFPEFFGVLDVSLLGKARARGLVDMRVFDLRDYTSDRHRTVDDTPFGGGPGMVMKPEPWGEALDTIIAARLDPSYPDGETTATSVPTTPIRLPTAAQREAHADQPLIVFPSPAGEVFTQRTAHRYAAEDHIVFGCGRYEGIDQRVYEYAATLGRVELVSLGDFVLNGGEVAVMAMIEAFGRLLDGVVGNPESLADESHEHGLLEYPTYTKPARWRGREVPEVLRSGDHGKVDRWRAEQSIERTRRTRPDLYERYLARSAAARHDSPQADREDAQRADV